MDGQMDSPSYRDARMHLKIHVFNSTHILGSSWLILVKFWWNYLTIILCQFVWKWEPFKNNYVKIVSTTISYLCFFSHVAAHISACFCPNLVKFWWKHIYMKLSNLWCKPHLSMFIRLEMGAFQRQLCQFKKLTQIQKKGGKWKNSHKMSTCNTIFFIYGLNQSGRWI